MKSGHWFETLRAILEVLYFVAGIAIAGAAFWGLQQIRLTKQIATKNAKREDLKFAAERCQYYADTVVDLWVKLNAEHERLKLTVFTTPIRFEVVNGEIELSGKLNIPDVNKQTLQVGFPLLAYMNSLEAFAIPFAAGVADDDLGFQETARAFCESVQRIIVAFVISRMVGPRYESCIRLYDCWSKRLKTDDLRKQMKDLEGKIKATPISKINPVGGV